jgi:cytochrome oxidase Cu insertion factor (SCO1/SenC/PrrC family)
MMSGRALVGVLVAVVLAAGSVASVARADGDPGSDVLVYQDLFAGSSAGLSVQQQARLGDLLKAASAARFPIRVAIIASPTDLGAVTALWREPRSYARFLGLELSLAYKQRLLVVMPNGFGFNWPGHSTTAAYATLARIPLGSGVGLFAAAQAAVRALAQPSGVKLATPTHAGGGGAAGTDSAVGSSGVSSTTPGQSADNWVALLAAVTLLLVGVILGVRAALRRRHATLPGIAPVLSRGLRRVAAIPPRRALPAFAALCLVAAGTPVLLLEAFRTPGASTARDPAFNPALDPGTRLSGAAPDFTLSDQFGQPVSLRSFRGKVVLLAFNDSECTTICPLTTQAMLDAKAMLGRAGSRVQLLGIDANPAAISLEDVMSYSQLHGMVRAWHFLTGSLPQLKRV